MTSRRTSGERVIRGLCRIVLALGLASSTAAAAPKKAGPPPKSEAKPAAVDLEAARRDLAGSNVNGAVDAAERLGKSQNPRAAEVLLDALAVGADPRVAAAALDALAALKNPRSVPILLHYARNRDALLRRKAVVALGSFREPRVTKALLARLGDSSKQVRAAAARLLAERRERTAQRPLFKLLRRGDEAAATALGAVASADMARQLAELLGQVSEGLLASALGEFIKRNDIGDPIRVDIVRTIAKMRGAEATAALVEYVGSVPSNQERPSKTEAQKLIEQRSQ